MAAKKTASSRVPKPAKKAAKPSQQRRGNLHPQREILPLVMAARAAYDIQIETGNIDASTGFDEWRREQVMQAVGKPGLTALLHQDWRPVMAHFQMLAGKDDAAFQLHMRSGRRSDKGDPRNTHENSDTVFQGIKQALATHAYLARTPVAKIIADKRNALQGPVPSDWIERIKCRAVSIALHQAAEKEIIGEAYTLIVARRKFHTQAATFEALRERLNHSQLAGLRITIVNRIAAREGIGSTETRNVGQKQAAARRRADPF
jgi:hypothetical protein